MTPVRGRRGRTISSLLKGKAGVTCRRSVHKCWCRRRGQQKKVIAWLDVCVSVFVHPPSILSQLLCNRLSSLLSAKSFAEHFSGVKRRREKEWRRRRPRRSSVLSSSDTNPRRLLAAGCDREKRAPLRPQPRPFEARGRQSV